jgi:putative exporter of polyketide antibiotics
MQKLTLSNNKSLDAYRTVALNKAVANNLSQLDKLNKKDSADQLVYKQGEDTYIAVGRGDLRGVKAGDTVNVGADKLEVLYVSNKRNTEAEIGNKELLKSAALPGSLVGACAAGLGAVIVGGPAAIAIGAIGGLVLGTLGIFAQMKLSMSGEPQSIWNKLK